MAIERNTNMSTTDKKELDNLIAKLRAQGILTWKIAYNATKDEHYLSYNKYTNSDNSTKLYTLAQRYYYTDQDIAQLLGANQPTMTFPNQIITAMTHLIVKKGLEPSTIINNLNHINATLLTDSYLYMVYGYVLAQNNKEHILDQLYALACKIQHDNKDAQNNRAISDLFYHLHDIYRDGGKDSDLYNSFEQLIKNRPDIRKVVTNTLQASEN